MCMRWGGEGVEGPEPANYICLMNIYKTLRGILKQIVCVCVLFKYPSVAQMRLNWICRCLARNRRALIMAKYSHTRHQIHKLGLRMFQAL